MALFTSHPTRSSCSLVKQFENLNIFRFAFLFSLFLVLGCSSHKKESEDCNEQTEKINSYFKSEFDEDVSNYVMMPNGNIVVQTLSGNEYTITNTDGEDYEVYDNSESPSSYCNNTNTYHTMDLGGGMVVTHDNNGNSYHTMDLGGGMTVTHDNNGNSYNTMDIGGGMTITHDNNGNSCTSIDLGGGITTISDNQGNSATIYSY